jgi:hypothetical protein
LFFIFNVFKIVNNSGNKIFIQYSTLVDIDNKKGVYKMVFKKKAFVNGIVHTQNESMKIAESIITLENKILFVGSSIDAESYIDSETEVIDLEGKLVLPGFIESHAHIIMGGFYLLGVNLESCKSRNEFTGTLMKFVLKNKSRWIKGGNWNHENWENAELPNKNWIDEFSKNTPILVHRMDYHTALANSYALNLAGITKDTLDPVGGKIERDADNGEPTGILKDRAIEIVSAIIPIPKEDELDLACLTALNEAKKFGITSIQDITYKNDFRTFQRIEKQNKLTCRIYTRFPIEICESLIASELQAGFGSEKLKVGSVKAFADGSLGSSTALFFEAYNDDPENYGLAMDYTLNGKLEDWAFKCDLNKLQISIHAIGDKAVSDTLDLFERIQNTNPKWDRRFRLEHAQHITAKDIKRVSDLNIIVSAQPYHLFEDGVWADKKVGKKRLADMFPFNSFISNDTKLCFGSDWSVVTLNPLSGIYAAVTRHTADGKNPSGIIPSEKITVEEAVKCYTINAAYAAYEEKEKGSIEVGKFADFIVLSENIFKIPRKKILDVKILKTIFDGEIIFQFN